MSNKIRVLRPGESLVASGGLVFAVIILLTMTGAGWWAARTQRETSTLGRTEQLLAAARSTRTVSERLLADGELSVLRQLISEVSHRNNLAICRIRLSDGRIVADRDPAQVTLATWPDDWPDAQPGQVDSETFSDDRMIATYVLRSGNRTAFLDLEAPITASLPLLLKTQTGIGLIGALSLIVLLVLYRSARKRMVALVLLREALLTFGRGDCSEDALILDEQLGAEVMAWNELLRSRASLREAASLQSTEQAIKMQADQGGDLTAAFDALWTGVLIVDEHLQIKYANGAATMMIPGSSDSLQGEPARDILPPEVVESMDRIQSLGIPADPSVEIERAGPGGVDVLRFTVRPARKQASECLLVMIEDVTQRRIADRARQSFVSQATHELRTPLTNIRLYVEMAIDDGEDDEKVRAKCLNVINQETRRLERMVADMLSVTEIETGSLSLAEDDVQVAEVLNILQADYGAMAKDRSITLGFDLSPKLPVLHGDKDKIEVVLHNLMGNAFKYTPEGGAVDVRADIEDDELVIEVSDTGFGIAEEDLERVFEKFYRASDPRVAAVDGTGLGLALAREIIRMHGGDIQVESQLNRGSTFRVTIPTERLAA